MLVSSLTSQATGVNSSKMVIPKKFCVIVKFVSDKKSVIVLSTDIKDFKPTHANGFDSNLTYKVAWQESESASFDGHYDAHILLMAGCLPELKLKARENKIKLPANYSLMLERESQESFITNKLKSGKPQEKSRKRKSSTSEEKLAKAARLKRIEKAIAASRAQLPFPNAGASTPNIDGDHNNDIRMNSDAEDEPEEVTSTEIKTALEIQSETTRTDHKVSKSETKTDRKVSMIETSKTDHNASESEASKADIVSNQEPYEIEGEKESNVSKGSLFPFPFNYKEPNSSEYGSGDTTEESSFSDIIKSKEKLMRQIGTLKDKLTDERDANKAIKSKFTETSIRLKELEEENAALRNENSHLLVIANSVHSFMTHASGMEWFRNKLKPEEISNVQRLSNEVRKELFPGEEQTSSGQIHNIFESPKDFSDKLPHLRTQSKSPLQHTSSPSQYSVAGLQYSTPISTASRMTPRNSDHRTKTPIRMTPSKSPGKKDRGAKSPGRLTPLQVTPIHGESGGIPSTPSSETSNKSKGSGSKARKKGEITQFMREVCNAVKNDLSNKEKLPRDPKDRVIISDCVKVNKDKWYKTIVPQKKGSLFIKKLGHAVYGSEGLKTRTVALPGKKVKDKKVATPLKVDTITACYLARLQLEKGSEDPDLAEQADADTRKHLSDKMQDEARSKKDCTDKDID